MYKHNLASQFLVQEKVVKVNQSKIFQRLTLDLQNLDKFLFSDRFLEVFFK